MAKTQTLSFPIRLPDAMQAEALRLLDASRIAINQIILDLWPQLDLFATDRTGPAWKQVEHHLLTRSGHGNRQERCDLASSGKLFKEEYIWITCGEERLANTKRDFGQPLRLFRELRQPVEESEEGPDHCNQALLTGLKRRA